VIESHNRFGGDHIKDLLQSAYGIDLVRLAVGWPFRLVGELQERPRPLGGACVRFLHRDPGRVVAVGGIEELRAQPEVILAELKVQAGDMVRPLRNNWDRLGLVAVAGPSSDAAVARCEELIQASVRIEMGDPAPLAEASA
jgi:hypothetical protein